MRQANLKGMCGRGELEREKSCREKLRDKFEEDKVGQSQFGKTQRQNRDWQMQR